jgi:hypothetical protein
LAHHHRQHNYLHPRADDSVDEVALPLSPPSRETSKTDRHEIFTY